MKIAVLCGGLTHERTVSLSSGNCIASALSGRGHEVLLVDLFYGIEGGISDPAALYERDRDFSAAPVDEEIPDVDALRAAGRSIGPNVIKALSAADIVFMALHGGDGENGRIQAVLDLAGIKYTGSGYLGSAIAMNKALSKLLFISAGIPTPEYMLVRNGSRRLPPFGFPCVVKPCSGGSSIGTSIASDPGEYGSALSAAFRYEETVLVEKYIAGREVTVGVIDGKATPAVEIIPKTGFYDYRNKYQPGLTEELCPAPLTRQQTEKLQRLGEKVCSALMIDAYCRADFRMDAEGEFYCMEANTLPGMTPTSLIPQMAAAQGEDFGMLCERIIRVSLKKYGGTAL